MNPLVLQVVRETYEVMIDFRNEDNLRLGLMTGAGDRAFCAAFVEERKPLFQGKVADRQ